MDKQSKSSLVSVIMPVYNGELYIQKSIESIYKQTYCAIELIIINDGSKDESAEKLELFKLKAPENVQVKLIHQENQGICYSRNRALDIATGKYVMFIDQDDYMREDCIATLCNEIEEKNTDFVIGGFDLVNNEGQILEEWKLNPKLPWSKFRITGPWGRIFRKDIIDRYNIRFMITKISEDFYFNMLYMSYCKNITVTSYRGYCWLFNEKSESHAKMSQLKGDRNPLVMLNELHKNMNTPNSLGTQYVEYMIVKHIIWYLFYVVKGAKKDEFRSIYLECFEWLQNFYPRYATDILKKVTFPKGENNKTKYIVKISVLLKKINMLYLVLMLYAKIRWR